MRLALVPLVTAILVACAAERAWVKPGMTEVGLAADQFECLNLAGGELPPPRPAAPATPGHAITVSPAPDPQAQSERQRIYERCMEARGYRRP